MASDMTQTTTDGPGLNLEGRRFRVSKTVTFEAAHFMGTKPEGHPYRNVHGHSFRIEASVAGTLQPGAEWVEDFADLTAALDAVAAKLDHRLLNEIDGLETPTLERLCVWVARELGQALTGLVCVEIARPSLGERVRLELG